MIARSYSYGSGGASEGKIRKRRRGAFDFLEAACALGEGVERGGVEGRVTQQALNGVERHLAPTYGEGRTEPHSRSSVDVRSGCRGPAQSRCRSGCRCCPDACPSRRSLQA
jgi:hypothetical protein